MTSEAEEIDARIQQRAQQIFDALGVEGRKKLEEKYNERGTQDESSLRPAFNDVLHLATQRMAAYEIKTGKETEPHMLTWRILEHMAIAAMQLLAEKAQENSPLGPYHFQKGMAISRRGLRIMDIYEALPHTNGEKQQIIAFLQTMDDYPDKIQALREAAVTIALGEYNSGTDEYPDSEIPGTILMTLEYMQEKKNRGDSRHIN